jgi:hypothetical protein
MVGFLGQLEIDPPKLKIEEENMLQVLSTQFVLRQKGLNW